MLLTAKGQEGQEEQEGQEGRRVKPPTHA